jgi:hypothetical protein
MNRNTNNRKRVHEQREIVQENKRFCLREELEEGEIVQENKRVCLREELEEGEIVQENKRVCLREELEEGEIAQEKVIQISKELPDIVDEIRDNYYGLDCGNTLCFEYLVTLKGIDVFTTKVKYQYGLCSRNHGYMKILFIRKMHLFTKFLTRMKTLYVLSSVKKAETRIYLCLLLNRD